MRFSPALSAERQSHQAKHPHVNRTLTVSGNGSRLPSTHLLEFTFLSAHAQPDRSLQSNSEFPNALLGLCLFRPSSTFFSLHSARSPRYDQFALPRIATAHAPTRTSPRPTLSLLRHRRSPRRQRRLPHPLPSPRP